MEDSGSFKKGKKVLKFPMATIFVSLIEGSTCQLVEKNIHSSLHQTYQRICVLNAYILAKIT